MPRDRHTAEQSEEILSLYASMRDLHLRNAQLIAALGPRYEESLWIQIRANDREIANLWDEIQILEEE